MSSGRLVKLDHFGLRVDAEVADGLLAEYPFEVVQEHGLNGIHAPSLGQGIRHVRHLNSRISSGLAYVPRRRAGGGLIKVRPPSPSIAASTLR
jgi:hypothetical protein